MGQAKNRGTFLARYNAEVQTRAMELHAQMCTDYIQTTKATAPKIAFKLVRQFAFGFAIMSPKHNGLCFSVSVACFEFAVWSRGGCWFGLRNYWNG